MEIDDLLQRNVLITGAGQNIGRSIALEFANQRANVYFTDIDHERVKRLGGELSKLIVNYGGFVSDVSKEEDNRKLIDNLLQKEISIDVLVNNVGISDKDSDFSNFNPAIHDKIMRTNANGPIYLTHLVFDKMMKERKQGSILFISSIHQDVVRRYLAYSMSKGAIRMAVKDLAVSLSPYNIRVNSISPGYTEEEIHEHKPTLLHQRSIDPAYLAKVAVFLASEECSQYTTGANINVDGGLSLDNHLVFEEPPGPDYIRIKKSEN